MLVDMFEQVCDVIEPGADNPRKRATHAIQRLREQRTLAALTGRVSFAPVSTHSHGLLRQ
jgi:chromosome partition protein MukF